MKKILPIIAVVVLLMLFMAPAASAAPPAWGGNWDGNCGGVHHCVTWGETLHSIGRMYNKDPQFLAQVNGLWNPNRIYAGQILYIPADGPSYPWYGHHPTGCFGWGCGDFGHPRPTPYGYGGTGHYYESNYPQYKRYSHTCDYYNNCY